MTASLVDRSRVAAAKAYAGVAHEGQTYGDHPYTKHLETVVEVVRELVSNPSTSLEIVSYLHDIVEDTEVTASDIADTFGSSVARSVEIITDPQGENRKAKKKILHAQLGFYAEHCSRPSEARALVVKIADRIANVRNCSKEEPKLLKMYKKEYPEFRAAFFHGERKAQDYYHHCFEDYYPNFKQWFDELDNLLNYKKE